MTRYIICLQKQAPNCKVEKYKLIDIYFNKGLALVIELYIDL